MSKLVTLWTPKILITRRSISCNVNTNVMSRLGIFTRIRISVNIINTKWNLDRKLFYLLNFVKDTVS